MNSCEKWLIEPAKHKKEKQEKKEKANLCFILASPHHYYFITNWSSAGQLVASRAMPSSL